MLRTARTSAARCSAATCCPLHRRIIHPVRGDLSLFVRNRAAPGTRSPMTASCGASVSEGVCPSSGCSADGFGLAACCAGSRRKTLSERGSVNISGQPPGGFSGSCGSKGIACGGSSPPCRALALFGAIWRSSPPRGTRSSSGTEAVSRGKGRCLQGRRQGRPSFAPSTQQLCQPTQLPTEAAHPAAGRAETGRGAGSREQQTENPSAEPFNTVPASIAEAGNGTHSDAPQRGLRTMDDTVQSRFRSQLTQQADQTGVLFGG